MSKEVVDHNWLVSLVLHKSSKIDLRHLKPSSIYVFTFLGCGLEFGVPSYGCVFWFPLGYMLIIVLQFDNAIYIN